MTPPRTMAALRDASWFAKPGRAGRYHVVKGDFMMACFAETTKGNLSGRPLVETTAMPAQEVPIELRCMRPGCRALWPDYRPAPTVIYGHGDALADSQSEGHKARLARAGAALKRHNGVVCGTCGGDGLVIVGWDPDAYENVEGPCPDCAGGDRPPLPEWRELALGRAVFDLVELAKDHNLGSDPVVRRAKELIRCSVQGCGHAGACDGEGSERYPCPLRRRVAK